MHVLPSLNAELQTPEVLAAALQPLLYMIEESTVDEYTELILPVFRPVFAMPKSVQCFKKNGAFSLQMALRHSRWVHAVIDKVGKILSKKNTLPLLMTKKVLKSDPMVGHKDFNMIGCFLIPD
ncbi:uncharacterized protein CDAR_378391 [Caerostris darwini]|uniref:Uncharacterized protein n=1 Tax=Caerostris darwini TaxID=1538125 RepID=A0AAV4T3Y3_9ARAC|nr:uncharacterized protein CDAR_378391 [Caerostris darwini]